MGKTFIGIEQGRADYAFNVVNDTVQGYGVQSNNAQRYKSYVRRVPMLIKTNGLGATFAYVKSKCHKEDAYEDIYRHVSEWLMRYDSKLLLPETDLVSSLVKLSTKEYRAVTIEVLALLNWLKRFADGLVEGEYSDEN